MRGRGTRDSVWDECVGSGCSDEESCVSYVYSKKAVDAVICITCTSLRYVSQR